MPNYMIENITQFIIIIGLIILYFSFKNLLPTYFGEKGKNLATKEDIGEITGLIEGVRHSFTTETEKLKANLSILTNIHTGLVAEERNAIVDFNVKVSYWLNILTDSHLGHLDENSYAEIEAYRRKIGDAYRDMIESECKLELFVDNSELHEAASDLKALALEQLVDNTSTYLFSLMEISILLEDINSRSNSTPEQRKEIHNKRHVALKTFSEAMLTSLIKIIPAKVKLQKFSRQHIYHLLDDKAE